MIRVDSTVTIIRIPDYNGTEMGRLQIASKKLASVAKQKLPVIAFILEPGEEFLPESIPKAINKSLNRFCKPCQAHYEFKEDNILDSCPACGFPF